MSFRNVLLWVSIGLTSCFIGYALFGIIFGPQEVQSKVNFEPPSIDLGKVPSGESRSFELSLFNHNDRDVLLRSIDVSCGCLTVSPNTGPIPARGKMPLKLVYTAGSPSVQITANLETSDSSFPVAGYVTVDVTAPAVTAQMAVDPSSRPPVGFDPKSVPIGATMPDGPPGADWRAMVEKAQREELERAKNE